MQTNLSILGESFIMHKVLKLLLSIFFYSAPFFLMHKTNMQFFLQ